MNASAGYAPGMMVQPTAADLAKELQQRITMFHAGDELYSGAWLADFQKQGTVAWQVCAEGLQIGVLKTCDQELAQAFCAQTLARLARAFTTWFQEPGIQQSARDSLEALLAIHARGQTLVWKQLSLALACAEMWQGTWAAAGALGADSLPPAVRRELLVLPSELLFDEKALPLTDRQLRESAGASLFRSCESVFPFLLNGLAEDFVQEDDRREALRILASWLRAVRKSLLWLPGVDASSPLRHLGALGQHLLAAAQAAPKEAAEVAQQLAKWKGATHEAASVLNPLLCCIFAADEDCQAEFTPLWLLPLLTDLAEDFWPKAALGELDLDWEAVARHAILALGRAAANFDGVSGEPAGLEDAEAAISVWQSFAETLQSAVRAAESFSPSGSTEPNPLYAPPPEKRSRRTHERWQLSAAKLAQARSLQLLFQLFAEKLLEHLRLPLVPEDEEALTALRAARAAAESALLPWAALAGNPRAWSEELLLPLRRVEASLAGLCSSGGEEFMAEDLARDIEVVLWFFGAVCNSMPEGCPGASDAAAAAGLAVQSLAPQLSGLDFAIPPWRALLWSSACSMAAAVNRCNAPDSEPVLLEWMLQRPPSEAGAPEMLEITELQYAKALEATCQRLPSGSAHPAVGERLFTLAFAEWDPASQQEERRVEVQAYYLSALRSAMGGQPNLLCGFVTDKVLPKLCQAADDEATRSLSSGSWAPGDEAGAPWPAHRMLFETLATLLPVGKASADAEHPSLPVWRQAWRYVEAALLKLPMESASDQPMAAAAQALRRAGLHAPVLLPEVLQLLAISVRERGPEVQLKVLREIVVGVPCPPVDPSKAAELLDAAVSLAAETLLERTEELVTCPEDLAAFFALLAEAVRSSPPGVTGAGPCEDRLRPLLLARRVLIGRCLHLVSVALPDCRSETCARQMLRFVTRLISSEEASPAGHASLLSTTLTPLCAALFNALAAQDFLAEPEGLAEAGELILAALEALPEEFPAALSAGLGQVALPDHSKALLQQHVASRGEWSQKGHWLEQLQQIVVEWQSERHLNVL